MDYRYLRIYAITDRSWLKDNQTLAEAVEQAILGGASIVQFREKQLEGQELIDTAKSVQEICKQMNVPFIINDNVQLALDLDADGVHVGQSDMAVKDARALLGPDKIIGATAKTIEQAQKAESEGADYLGSGAIFGTTTKTDALPMTPELLDSICDNVDIPVVAIGGIDKNNIALLKDVTIAGVAIVSGIFAQPNITQATRTLIKKLYGTPIVQCITNHVTVNQVANTILAVDASPIMAHHPLEVEDVQQNSDALLINLGAIEDLEAMKIAARTAYNLDHPIIIDPVGVGGIDYRRKCLKEILSIARPSCIRGNFAEIKAIYEDLDTMRGLDNIEIEADETIVLELANRLGCIVVASGPIDIISDGKIILKNETGHPIQSHMTGSGCMLSAAIAGYLSYTQYPSAKAVATVCKMMGECAQLAAEETIKNNKGIMTFQEKWIDQIYLACKSEILHI